MEYKLGGCILESAMSRKKKHYHVGQRVKVLKKGKSELGIVTSIKIHELTNQQQYMVRLEDGLDWLLGINMIREVKDENDN